MGMFKYGKFDVEVIEFVDKYKLIDYLKLDGVLLFDCLINVSFSVINYEES